MMIGLTCVNVVYKKEYFNVTGICRYGIHFRIAFPDGSDFWYKSRIIFQPKAKSCVLFSLITPQSPLPACHTTPYHTFSSKDP